MNDYLAVLRKYATLAGRARRREYWRFVLFNLLVSLVLGVLDAMTGTFHAEAGLGLLGGLYGFAVLLPSLAVSVRRLHDTDRSGWWLLVGLVPLLGALVLIVFAAQEGKAGTNRYGTDPKREGTARPSAVGSLRPSSPGLGR